MGVPFNDRYKVTQHAKDRYMERINNSIREIDMLKDFSHILRNADFLAKEHKGRESWLLEEKGIVIIIDPKKYSVITIYNSVEQYDNAENDNIEKNDLHPKVLKLFSNYSKQAYIQQEKYYFEKLAPLYKEYGERIDKLSRTRNTEHFDNKKIELNELQQEITQIVTEKNRILKDIKQFIEN